MFNPIKFYLSGVANKPFISTWKTDNLSAGSTLSNQIKLPLSPSGSFNFRVEWGDGSSSNITQANDLATTHTYSVAGTYTLKITGLCSGWAFGNTGDRLKLLSITQWGPLILGTTEGNYFYGCANLTLTNVTDVLNLSGRITFGGGVVGKTTTLTGAFRDCSSLTTVNRMDEWNTSEVTLMNTMFQGASLFNQYIGSWNTSSATNLISMFQNAASFNQDISQKTVTVNGVTYTAWNVLNVSNFGSMFADASVFNQPIGNWTLKSTGTISMASMFVRATAFNQSLNSWNTIAINNVSNMFQLSGFNNGLPSGVAGTMHWDLPLVTSFGAMFNGASSFNQNVGSWNVANITNFFQMFFGTTKFNNGGSADIANWNIRNTGDSVSMRQMFQSATIFNQPIGAWTTGSVTNMSNMFTNAPAFNQPVGSWNTVNVTTMNSMFQGATAFNQNIGSWDIRNVTDFTNFMSGKTALTFSTTNLDAIYNGWSTRPAVSGVGITFGTAKYTAGGSAGKAILQASPKLWIITDGGI